MSDGQQPNRVRALDITCPACDAAPGSACTNVRTHRGRFHHERVGAAASASRKIGRAQQPATAAEVEGSNG